MVAGVADADSDFVPQPSTIVPRPAVEVVQDVDIPNIIHHQMIRDGRKRSLRSRADLIGSDVVNPRGRRASGIVDVYF